MKPKGVTTLVKVYCGAFFMLVALLIAFMGFTVGLVESNVQSLLQLTSEETSSSQAGQVAQATKIEARESKPENPLYKLMEESPTDFARLVLIVGGVALIPLLVFLFLPPSRFAWWLGLINMILSLPTLLFIPGVVLILLWLQGSVRKYHKFKTS